MQKIKFINANGDEIDFTSGCYGVTGWKGLSNANLNLQTQKVPDYDGSVYIDGLLENREIELNLVINDGNNLQTRYEKRQELCKILNPKLGEGYLYYENDAVQRRIKAISETPIIENKNADESGSVKATLVFICPDVYWEDVEETSVNINMGQRINVENTGDIEISPRIAFNCNSALNPILRNLNNGKKISVNGTLSSSILNLEKGKKTFLKIKYGFTNNNNYDNFEENDEYQYLFSTNCISRTKDFENFETIYIIPSENVVCSGYGRGLFFYGGDNLKKSTDCINWETISEKPSGTVQAMYYDKTEDIFYFGIDGHLYSTSDLETFTDVGSIGVTINAITRHSSLIVCVGNEGNCYKYDGTNFTSMTTGTSRNLFAVASDGTNLVIGGGLSSVEGVFKYSTDNGSTWNTVSVTQMISSICYSNTYGIFFACGDIIVGKGLPANMVWEELGTEARKVCKESKLFGQIEILGVDMVIYSGEFKKICNYPYDIICGVYFKGKYIAAGAFGHIYISDNYTWWEESSASGKISNNIYFAEITNDTAYFFTKEGDIVYTTDGVNFSYIPKVINYEHIIYFNHDYYATYGNKVYKINVYDILDTSLVLESTLGGIGSVHVANNKLICLCDNGFEVTADGSTWTSYFKGTITEDLYDIVFYNNKYYVLTTTKVYETSDFSTFTEVLSSYVSETSRISNIAVLNNDFFFAVQSIDLEHGYYESTLYKGLSTPVIIDSIIGAYFNFYFSNGNYIINREYYDSSTETVIDGAKVTDFNGFTQEYNNYILVDNDIFYDVDMSENTLSKNGVLIMELNSPFETMIITSNNVTINNYSLCFLSTGGAITSSVDAITSVYVDDIIYITATNGLYTVDTNNKIEKHSDSELFALTGNDNYIFIFGLRTITKYAKTDLSTAIETYAINNLTSVNNGACLYYNDCLIWAIEGYVNIYNISTGIKTEISTNVLINDIKVIDNTVFAIGQGGFIYTTDLKNITELYKVSFVFTTFVRNNLKKFIALYGALGEFIILNDENIISMITDISFELQEGENKIVLNCDSGYINAVMTYRSKYTGV